MKTDLSGRVALITGGTSGIGAAICKQLATSGAKVATNYRNEQKAQKWLAEMRAEGYDVKLCGVDATDFDACGRMIGEIEKDPGPIDILVNNAGITAGRDATQDEQRAMGHGTQDQSRQCLQCHAARHFGNDRPWLWADHQYLVHQRPERSDRANATTRLPRPACMVSPCPWRKKSRARGSR